MTDPGAELREHQEGGRRWTPAEATATLPLVRRIVDDLVTTYRAWRKAVEGFEYATAGAAVGAANTAANTAAEQLMADAQSLAGEIDSLRGELARLEVVVVRVEHGVVGYRSRLRDSAAMLYWLPGAETPSYDWPIGVPEKGTSTSWPSRAQVVAGKRSRA